MEVAQKVYFTSYWCPDQLLALRGEQHRVTLEDRQGLVRSTLGYS